MTKKNSNEEMPDKMIEEAEENWKEVFDAGGNSLTPTRLAILKFMWKKRNPQIVKEIHLEIKKISSEIALGTIYRNLDMLVQMDLVHKYEFGNGQSAFALSELGRHYSFVCSGCGRIFYFERSILDKINFTDSIEKYLLENYRFQPQAFDLNFNGHGRCTACRNHFKFANKLRYLKYPPPRFEITRTTRWNDYGEFFWGDEDCEIIERYWKFYELISRGNTEGLLTSLEKMAVDAPDFIGAYKLMGRLEIGNRDFEKAITHLEKAVKVGEDLVPEDFQGEILWDLEERESQDNQFFLESLSNLGKCYLKAGNPDDARICLRQLTLYNPGFEKELGLFIADACLQLGYIKQARPHYRRKADCAHGKYGMGIIRFKRRKPAEAISDFRAAFVLNPYIAEMLTGGMEMTYNSEYEDCDHRLEIGAAYEYIDCNLRFWRKEEKLFEFFKSIYKHPLVSADIRELLSLKREPAEQGHFLSNNEEEQNSKASTLKRSIMAKIDPASSQKIFDDWIARGAGE